MDYLKLYEGKTLFHFCASQFLPGIKKSGLRFGKIPFGTMDNIQLINGYQWLTTNAAFLQTWNQYSTLPYDRTECRLTIILPNAEKFNLIKWTDFNKDNPNPLYDTLNEFGDFENWYLFKGVVIPYWIADIKYKGAGGVILNSKTSLNDATKN